MADELDNRHPHDVVAEIMGGSSMLNGGPSPHGEEFETVTRYLEMHQELLIILVPLIITYLVVIRCCFNSWTLSDASRKYKTGESFASNYNMLFDRRNQLESQYSWAKSRDDEESMSTIRGQIADLDIEIDKLEESASNKKHNISSKTSRNGENLRKRGNRTEPTV